MWGQREGGTYSQHPRSIFDILRIGLNISVIESTTIMHVNLVVIFQMHHKERDIAGYRTFSSCVRTVEWPVFTVFLMLMHAVVREDFMTTHNLVSTWELERFYNFLQCQTPYIS